MDKQTQSLESLNRAKHGDSLLNYQTILSGFASKGIAHNDIIPRENVFTYKAWLLLLLLLCLFSLYSYTIVLLSVTELFFVSAEYLFYP